MAATKRRHKRATGQRNAGSRRRHSVVKVVRHNRRRSNPGRTVEYVKLGAAVVGGAVGSKLLTQTVLGGKNSSWMGYLGNVVATGLLGWGATAAFKDKIIAQGVVGGGLAQVIIRMIGDLTPYGSYLSGTGVGDYQASGFLTPQRMLDARNSAALQQPTWAAPAAVVVTNPVSAAGSGVGGFDWN